MSGIGDHDVKWQEIARCVWSFGSGSKLTHYLAFKLILVASPRS